MNGKYPFVFCNKPQAIGFIKSVAGDVKNTISFGFESLKTIETEIITRNFLGDVCGFELNSAAVGRYYGHPRFHPSADIQVVVPSARLVNS